MFLHVMPAASTACVTTLPRVSRVRSCAAPKPRSFISLSSIVTDSRAHPSVPSSTSSRHRVALVLLHPPSSVPYASHPSRALSCACTVRRPLGPRVRSSFAVYLAPHDGPALRTCALHRSSSEPEPLSSRAALRVCSPSCGTTTPAKLPCARSHPTCVS
jgi:hypothetical protein